MKNVKRKKLGRRILSFILSAVLVVGLMPGNVMTVSAEDTATVSADEWLTEDGNTVTIDGTLGGKTTATDDDITALVDAIKGYVDSGITTITVTGSNPAIIDMNRYTNTAIGEAIFRLSGSVVYDESNPYNGKIDLILPDVTEIVDYEFQHAHALNSINLPKVTTIGVGGIEYCYYLQELTFGSVVTSIKEDSYPAFTSVGRYVDGGLCDLVLSCRQQTTAATEYQPNLGSRLWWGREWKSITLAHSGGEATCTTRAVCSGCSANYGEVDPDNHTGTLSTYAPTADGSQHAATWNCCNKVETAVHTAEPTYSVNKDDRTKHDVTYSCCGTFTEVHSGGSYSVSGAVITDSCTKCGTELGTATISATGKTYDGAAVEANVEKTGTLADAVVTVVYYEGDTELASAPVNAGTYTAKITYNDKTASITYTIAKADSAVATAPTAVAGLTYNSSAQALITEGTATDGTMQYSLTENGTYSETIPTGTNAGSYTVWYKVEGDANYNNTTPARVDVSIARQPVTVTADNASKTYGEANPTFTYTPTGLVGSDTLTGELTREEGENVGTYAITQGTLTNENNPNYTISFENGTFTINKATAPAVSEPEAGSIIYGQLLSASALSGGWTWADGNVIPVVTNDGYEAVLTVDDVNYDYTGVDGYNAATHTVSRTISVVVQKAPLTVTANSYTIKLYDSLPDPLEYTVAGLQGTTDTITNIGANVTVSYSSTATSSALGTYPIEVKGEEETANYAITYINGVLNVVEKLIPTITASDITLTYGDSSKKVAAQTTGDGAFTYTVVTGTDVISIGTDGTITVLKTGVATVTITAEETENYASATKTISVTVAKAQNAPNLPSAAMNVSYETKTVGEVTLPTGWAWAAEDASKALAVGEAVTATAVYNGVDKGNYETETIEVAITRSSCSHSGGTATCKDKAVCTVCGTAYGDVDATNHGKVATVWSKDANGHWHECEGCGTDLNKADHSYTSEVTKQPTVDAEGERTYTCSICGYSYTEVVDKLDPTPTPGGSSGGGYYPPYYPSYPTATPTPAPTATPAPTEAPSPTPSATPTVAPSATPTPVPGTVTVPTSGETVVNENGEEVTSVVQEPGTTTKLSIHGLTDVKPEEGKKAVSVVWESTNPDVAEVDENGNITMKQPGLAEIVVTVGEGEEAKTETIVVLVEEPRTYKNPLEEAFKDVRLGTSWADIPLIRYQKTGETVDINFWGVKNWKQSNYEYIWETSDESVAVVDGKGRVTALKPGVFDLTLGLKNKTTGNFLNVQSVEIVIPGNYEDKILLGTSRNNTFDSLVLNLNERIDINFYGVKNWKKNDYEYYWSSSEPSVVWVDSLGRLTPVNPGTAEVFLVLVEKKTGAPRYVVPVTVTVPEK